MKYTTLLLLFLSLTVSSVNGQSDSIPSGIYGTDYNVTDNAGKKQGRWMRVYEEGQVYYIGQFKDGTPVGEFVYYYQGGEVMTIATHIDNFTSDAISYRKNGSVVSVGSYTSQKKSGLWMMYDENGVLAAEENYTDDVLDGQSKIYYKNGQLAKNMAYTKAELNGPWKEFFENGSLKGEGTYVYGKQHGQIVAYQAPKIKIYEGELKNDLAVGEWRYYLDDGRLKLKVLYDDLGVEVRRKFENGEIEEFYESGIPKSYYEYKHGKINGPFEEFYNQGDFVRREIIPTESGQAIEFKESLENTQLKKEGEYRMGRLEGEIIYYNEDGTILKKEFYEDGVISER